MEVMTMLDFLYRAAGGRHDIVKRTVEEEGEKYLKSIYCIENKFYSSFFEECVTQRWRTPMSISLS